MTPVLPGSTIGILGSGQLGRMLALAARPLGYRIHVYAPDADGAPASQVADTVTSADYLNEAALDAFAADCDVITIEFENIPARTLERLAAVTRVHPGARALHITQNRLREKNFLVGNGLPLARFAHVRNMIELEAAAADIGLPAVLKTAGFGYDGKGQLLLEDHGQLAGAEALLAEGDAVLEGFVDFEREVSIIAARSSNGETGSYGLFSNRHADHILDVTTAGGQAENQAVHSQALLIAERIMAGLDYVGVLCVELFQQADGSLLVNEIAPRVHNSGHLTIEASRSSQFQQHIRAICGLPLGDFGTQAAAMANLLGDEWSGGEPDWAAALADPRVQLHLYGKAGARAGRKMGHLTAVAASEGEAEAAVKGARRALRGG